MTRDPWMRAGAVGLPLLLCPGLHRLQADATKQPPSGRCRRFLGRRRACGKGYTESGSWIEKLCTHFLLSGSMVENNKATLEIRRSRQRRRGQVGRAEQPHRSPGPADGGERRDEGADSGGSAEGAGAQQQVHRAADRPQVAAGVRKGVVGLLGLASVSVDVFLEAWELGADSVLNLTVDISLTPSIVQVPSGIHSWTDSAKEHPADQGGAVVMRFISNCGLSTAPQIKLIDLRGIDQRVVDDSVINQYAGHNDAILLVVIPAMQAADVVSFRATRLAKDIDSDGTRTVGVISKVDQVSGDAKTIACVQALLSVQEVIK